MKDGTTRFFEFGEFRLDARKRLLLKNGENAQISPRIFDLLLVLVQNEGEILSHDDLLDKVWDGAFVEQSNLKKSISALRHILGEHPDQRLYVQTVPRRGYSFVAPVRAVGDEPEAVYLRETHTEIIVEEIEESYEIEAAKTVTLGEISTAPQLRRSTAFRRKTLVIGAAVALVLVLSGIAVWFFRDRGRAKFSFDGVKISRLTSFGNADGALISPDGKYIIFASSDENGASLMLQQVLTGQSARLTPPVKASIYFYNFTPDSQYVEYSIDNSPDASQNGYFRIALLGGSPERLSSSPRVIAPDNTHAVFNRAKEEGVQVIVANLDGSDERVIATLNSEYRIWSTKWSPDSTGVLLALRKLVPGNIVHYVVEYPIKGSPERIVVPEMEKQITSAIWLPDKSGLLLCLREVNSEARQIWQYTLSNGQFQRVTNDNSSYSFLSSSDDGKSVVTSVHDGFSKIWIADADKMDFHSIKAGANGIDRVGWTADGRIIFSAVVNKVESIFVVDAGGSNQRQITKGDDGLWLAPSVSSDGRSILYASTRTGRKQLWRVDMDGQNLAYLTNFNDLQTIRGKLLSDNQSVIFQGYGRGPSGLLYFQHADGSLTNLTDKDVDYWDISPDEKMLAYVARDPDSRRGKLFIRRLDDSKILQSFDAEISRETHWTRDGKTVTYVVNAGDQSEIYNQSVSGGQPKLLARFSGERIYWFDWSMDGKKLAIAKGKDINDIVLMSPGQ